MIVEYLDPETGELIKELRDKVKKKKITPLKRAILRKRAENQLNRKKDKNVDKSFETVSEQDAEEDEAEVE